MKKMAARVLRKVMGHVPATVWVRGSEDGAFAPDDKEVDVLKYPAMVREIDPADGGGFLVEFPDLPGCIADGHTAEEALINAKEAVEEWIDAAAKMGRPIPEPNSNDRFSGKWVQRVPKSLHQKLAAEAKREGVSLNSFALTLLAEGIGRRKVAA
ncbi:MAG TPA: type II toxin-antitoxin system HicB family antitoxin [Alphaproteobacteria bacterium]|nr:type II toxin-antitoxin system HicB family antitoxin [Alphaproteobacteria bacterium]